ncbi:hypothetical protein W97_01989 [Coniosporium apollinis CBS 100218]|uniref:Uncharacterized protein n=1 Tax=Coniosporium apollinis (strain CBS 100218) TaxID=1168221 RepID=R7YLS3_CONA1|nr:uncharacterized protein W97_01989 [Coniosporium apollinis CBS 100218]EON62764.1 hypothetical protein W97_01989 [Coniosporium apollinis CBS 100218]
MTDSPAVRIPLDPHEQPILDRLLSIRTELELLKQDKSTYVKSQDVINLYNQVVDQVELLNGIRTQKRHEQNRVDTVLDDCFQLISLAYLTIGKNNEAPAVYSAVSTIKRLLEHLREAAFFSPKDLESISSRLQNYREAVERGRETHSPHLLLLVEARIDICQDILSELQDKLSQLDEEQGAKYEKLVSILRSLAGCSTKSKFPAAEVDDLYKQLKEIEASLDKDSRPTAKSPSIDELAQSLQIQMRTQSPAPSGQRLVKDLLTRCFLWVELVKQKQGQINENFRDTYEKLRDIRNQLERLTLTQAWSLRETDLYSFQRQLDRVDESRVDGNFLDAEGRPADLHAQRTLLYLLRKSYALIYHLIISSAAVSEPLLPIYNQLTTLRRCLVEVKKSGGVSSPRELYPYSMKLNSIDNMRIDGKFMVGDEIPDGQANVIELLEECFELAYELRVQAEDESEEERKDEKEEGEDEKEDDTEDKSDDEDGSLAMKAK